MTTTNFPAPAFDMPTSLEEFQARARELLEGPHWDGLFSEEGDRMWRTNSANKAAFERWTLRPRVLTGGGEPILSTTILGNPVSFPVAVAPSASHQRVCQQGELATARAAERAETLMILSTLSNFSVGEVATISTAPLWFQLYLLRDRDLTIWLVRQAEQAGCTGLVVSVDNVAGRPAEAERDNLYRLKDIRPPRTFLAADRHMRNFAALPETRRPTSLADLIDPALSWRDIAWLQSQTMLPIIIKGIQTAEDAKLCREHGIRAIIVSNHGGVPVELEGVRASLDALPEVSAAVGRELEIYVDGGIRSGRDILKALALGARAVLIGRSIQWGLAVGGEDGAFAILQSLRRELTSAMGICGIHSVNEVPRTSIERMLP